MKKQEAIIQTQNLVKKYGDLEVLKSVDLSVPEHSIFGFLGPNGAGKSTTMKILLGLCKPTAGSVRLMGQDVSGASLQARTQIGYLPQHPTFPEYMTAREVLDFAGRFFVQDDSLLKRRVDFMLEAVGLTGKGDRKVNGFSGGERQRLGIAQAQIHSPRLLILDEPAAALDPLGRHDVLKIMEQLRKESTIFYSTHILDDVQQISDTVAILNQGKLITQGPIENLLKGAGEVSYRVRIKDDSPDIQPFLKKLPFVSEFNTSAANGEIVYQIWVSDNDSAEQELLRLILSDPGVRVTHFQQTEFELEEIFMDMIGREKDGS
jgi:ABC-2 type transport system ATP-binding protein